MSGSVHLMAWPFVHREVSLSLGLLRYYIPPGPQILRCDCCKSRFSWFPSKAPLQQSSCLFTVSVQLPTITSQCAEVQDNSNRWVSTSAWLTLCQRQNTKWIHADLVRHILSLYICTVVSHNGETTIWPSCINEIIFSTCLFDLYYGSQSAVEALRCEVCSNVTDFGMIQFISESLGAINLLFTARHTATSITLKPPT